MTQRIRNWPPGECVWGDCRPYGRRPYGRRASGTRLLLQQLPGLRDLAAVGIEELTQRLLHAHARRPLEIRARVVDLGHAILDVLIALAIVLGRRGIDQPHL